MKNFKVLAQKRAARKHELRRHVPGPVRVHVSSAALLGTAVLAMSANGTMAQTAGGQTGQSGPQQTAPAPLPGEQSLPPVVVEQPQAKPAPKVKKAAKKTPAKAKAISASAASAAPASGPGEAVASTGVSGSGGEGAGTGTSATGDTIGYATVANTTATKTNTSILETPVSVQVVPREVLTDQKSVNLEEAVVGNVSGVQRGWSYGGLYENFIIRGFETQLSTHRNGFQIFQAPSELSNVEQVEVIKGPGSVLYGRVEPGGFVNIVTRKPEARARASIEQQSGSFSSYRTTLDATGPANQDGSLLYRFTGSYVNADSFRDFLFDEHVFLAPSLTWRPDAGTEITIAYEYKSQAYSEDVGVPVTGSRPGPLSVHFSAQEPGVRDEFEGHLWELSGSHRLNESWKLQGGAVVYDNAFNLSNTFSNGLDADGRTLYRGYFVYDDLDRTSYGGHLDLVGDAGTREIRHRLLIGTDYLNYNEEIEGGFQPITPLDIFAPEYGTVDLDELFRTTPRIFNFISKRDGHGVYAQDQISLWDRVHILLGGRYDWLTTAQAVSELSLADARGAIRERKDEAFTPRLGIVVQPIKQVSLYGSYSEGFGLNFGTTADGTPFAPSTSEQYEAGIKTDFFNGRLTSTLGFYELTKQNIPTADPTTPDIPFDQVAIGEARSRGIEFDLAGEIGPGLSIIATYAYTDTVITGDNSGNTGNRLANVPRHSGSVWGKYEFQDAAFKGLSAGAGVYLAGERQGDNENTFVLPAYARVDAFAAYTWDVERTRWTAQLNVKNLFDTEYYTVTNTLDGVPRAQVIPGEPLTVTGSIRIGY